MDRLLDAFLRWEAGVRCACSLVWRCVLVWRRGVACGHVHGAGSGILFFVVCGRRRQAAQEEGGGRQAITGCPHASPLRRSAALAAAGRWCDAVDPRSGTALHGRRGARWSEVAGARALRALRLLRLL